MNTNLTPSLGRSRGIFRALCLFLGLALAPLAFAQVVSSGITGFVGDKGGKPVAGATVTATHVPTGTSYTATTRLDGRYNFRGLIVGGPYNLSVSNAGYKPEGRAEVSTRR